MIKVKILEKAGEGDVRPCLWLIVLLSIMPLFGGILSPSSCRGDLVDLLEIPALIPERDILQNNTNPVVWKKTWDEARYLVRSGDFSGAEKKYEELLVLKSNIEAARWEYGRLLLKLGDWEKSAAIMELLVEKDPERVVYLNGLALALRKSGQFGRALDLFKKAHENDRTDLTALVGLTQGLVEVGRKKEAFPLLEEVFARRPGDISIHRALANLAFELGKLETARKLMMPLVNGKDANLETLLMTARIYEGLKQERRASIYWQRCLKYDPDHREAHGRLALYFEKRGSSGKAMPHLLALLENDPQNASLLRRICRIYIQTDHFAEALPYFERYVALQPDNLDGLMPVIKNKEDSGSDAISLYRRLLAVAVTPDDLDILDALTKDLLTAGDAETALFMWEHVARLYPGRVEVYQEIVDLLEKLGRDDRLAEVLEVLHRLAPKEIKIVTKLANLKVAQGDLLVGLDYYNKLEKAGYGAADLFEGRGALYEDLGRLAFALADYQKLLALQPNRHDIRRRCIVLASKLGENVLLDEQVALLDSAIDAPNRDSDLLLVARAFADARDFDQSLMRYQRLIASRTDFSEKQKKVVALDPFMRKAKFGLAELYQDEGLLFEAEQVFREIFLAGGEQKEVLKRLFNLALLPNNYRGEAAEIWLDRYFLLDQTSIEGFFMKARFLTAEGDYAEAEDLLEKLPYDSVAGERFSSFGRKRGEVMRRAGLLLVEVFIGAGNLAKAERQCLAMLRSEQDRDVLVLLQKIYDMDGEDEASSNIFRQLLDDADDNSKLLNLAELFRRYGLHSSQIIVAEKVLLNSSESPGSLSAAFFLAEGLEAVGKSRESIKLLENMATIFPENSSIILRMAHHYFLNGQYASALQHCDRFLERNPTRLDAHLLKARSIAALAEHEYAENMTKELFPVKTEVVIEKSIAEAGIKVALPPVKRSLLQILTFSSAPQYSLIKELMGASRLVDNSTKEKKELNSIAVRLYARYRWEQEFKKFLALNN